MVQISGYNDFSELLIECQKEFSLPAPILGARINKKFTGQDNILILDNLNLLNVLGKKVILRCPIIPGFNDRDDHFLGISKTANCFECIEHIEIEPSHSLGAEKYEALGRKHPNIAVPEAAAVEGWLEKLRSLTEKEVKRA